MTLRSQNIFSYYESLCNGGTPTEKAKEIVAKECLEKVFMFDQSVSNKLIEILYTNENPSEAGFAFIKSVNEKWHARTK